MGTEEAGVIKPRGTATLTWNTGEGAALSVRGNAAGALVAGAFPATASELIWSEPLDEWMNFIVQVSIEKTAHTTTFPVTTGAGYAKIEAWSISAEDEKSLLRIAANFGAGVTQPTIVSGNTQAGHDVTLPSHLLPSTGVGSGFKASHPLIFMGGNGNFFLQPLPFYRIGYVISIDPDVNATGTESLRFTINELYTGRVQK